MQTKGIDIRRVTDLILAVTKEGPVTGWAERIAQLAERAELPVSRIDWQGSPASIAFRVIEAANGYGYVEALLAEIERTKKANGS
jgi:hypothetical protein